MSVSARALARVSACGAASQVSDLALGVRRRNKRRWMETAGGIVRLPRRPPGWRAPGPHPAAGDVTMLGPRAGEDLCYLAGEWRILQRLDGHRWSLDDLVTAWVAADELAAEPPERMVDLGCGIGTVLMLLA